MSSRKYIKRIWRVPKDRGAPEFLGTLVCKLLVKHGWPAKMAVLPEWQGQGFEVLHVDLGVDAPDDFWEAVSIAVRIVARTHRADVDEYHGRVWFQRLYSVNAHGVLREIKQG